MSYYESPSDVEKETKKKILTWAINWALTYQTPEQEELAKKHGTPKEFAVACEKAFLDGFITADELLAGVEKYVAEWKAAGIFKET